MALTLEDVDDIIKEAQPELLLRLKLNPVLLAKLRRADVVTESLDDALNVPTLTQHEKITKLLDYIKAGPVYRFLNFCKTVSMTDQRHLLEIMKVKIDAIDAQIASTCEGQSPAKTGCPPAAQERRFKQQRDYYKTKLAYSPIYQYATRSPLAHLDEIFTNIQLVDNQNDKGLTRRHSMWSNHRKVQLNDVFKVKGNGVLSIILEGKPGNGKSTIMKSCAVDWARGKDDDGSLGHRGKSPLGEKDLLIFIDKHHEGKTFDETIRNAIRGTNAEKEDGLLFLRESPESTFIFVDGIDEFLQKEVREEIFKLAEDCTVNIIVSCRQEHPYLEGKMGSFNRHIRIEGFIPEDAMAFTKSFMKVLSNGNDEDTVLHQKCEALCSFLSKKETHRMYASPINCAFLCILYSAGEVKEHQLATLKSKDLYAKQQDLLLKREFAKAKGVAMSSMVEGAAQATIRGIHRMALHSLLHEEMKSSYSAEEVQKFGIDLSSPAMVMLQVEYEETSAGPIKMFCWPHQTIREFHAANAAKDPAIMYVIASKPQLNEVTKFLISSLVETEPEFVKELMTAFLLLQSESPSCLKSTWKKFKLSLSDQKHACLDIAALKQFVADQDVDKLLQQEIRHTKMPTIQRLTHIQKCQKEGDWMVQNIHTVNALLNMTSDCDITTLLADIFHPFLPSISHTNLQEAQILDADSDDETTEDEADTPIAGLWKAVAAKIPTTFVLLPSPGEMVIFGMVYVKPGLVSTLVRRVIHEEGDAINVENERTILASHGSIKDCLADISHPFVKPFSKKCGRPDYIRIATEDDDDPGHTDSNLWKETIVEFNRIFRPRKGLQTQPDCESIMRLEDIKELRDLGIRLIDEDGDLIMVSDGESTDGND